jgi:hypothetical protein
MSMPLFLEVHNLNDENPQALADARSCDGVRCLKHWLSENGRQVALLVDAPSEDALRLSRSGANETTELFAPAERWMSYAAIDVE